MKLIIDNLNEITGWSGTATVYGTNDHLDYVSGYNTKSLVFQFNDQDSYVEKTYGVDVSNYDILTMYLYSRNKQKNGFNKVSDFYYKIDLGTGKEFYLPTWPGFTYITIDISNIDIIDRIRITTLDDDVDFLVVSYLVASKDEFPLDIFKGIKEGIETYRDELDTILIGTINSTVGDVILDLTDMEFIDDYSVIKIDDGGNSEIHQILRNQEELFKMSELYDGKSILNNFTDANTYLYLPVEFGRETLEAIVPGITIWGFVPNEKMTSFKMTPILDSWTDNGPAERQEGHYMVYPLQIEGEARQYEILAKLSLIIRNFIGRETLYVNGRKMHITFDGEPVEFPPDKDYDIIPKVLYRGTLEIQEELWERVTLPLTTSINFQVEIQ